MKNTTKIIILLAGAMIFGTLAITGSITNYQKNQKPAKPTVMIEEINMAPREFFKCNEDIMMPFESTIYQKYKDVPKGEKGNKWTEKRRYVYIIQYNSKKQRKAAAEFSRKSYLDAHQGDAVDKKLIFSDQQADPKIFNIQEAATTK